MTKLISTVSLVAVFIITTSEFLSDNGKAGYTGSPGETKCNNCHNSYALNSGGGSVTLGSDMLNWQYEPGTTYHMTFKVARTGNHLFGMGLEALNSSNANAGTLVVTNTHTQLKNKTVSNVVRTNMVHTLNGGSSTDSMIFTFNWTAPATNIGNITMYFSGVAANANGNENSDYVYNSSQVLTPMIGTGIEHAASAQLSFYPNPASGEVHVNGVSETADVRMFDASGRLVKSVRLENGSSAIDISDLLPGMYFISIAQKGSVRSSRLLVN